MKKNVIKREISTISGLCVREAQGGEESREIEGYALKFGVRSVLLCDWWDDYYEVLEQGCITKELLDQQDILLTLFHDGQLILAHSVNGEGTLSYEVDATGVKFRAEMPHTVDGDKALELVRRGDIKGCSFIYSIDDEANATFEKVTEGGKEIVVRHVHKIDHVYDFTLTPHPAYPQTEVSRRAAEQAGIIRDPQLSIDTDKKRANIKAVRDLAKNITSI